MHHYVHNESYINFAYGKLPGDNFYAVRDRQAVDEADKFILTEGHAMTINYYRVRYVSGSAYSDVLPMVSKHDGSVMFWLDLAFVLDLRKTLERFIVDNVEYVLRDL